MAVTTVKQQDNTLSMLGTLAAIGGIATGQPRLSALGTGMQGMNAMMSGDSSLSIANATNESLITMLDKLKNIAKSKQQNITVHPVDLTGGGR